MSEMLIHKVSISSDEEKLFLNVEYDKRFKIEKQFKNNIMGVNMMEQARNKLNTDEKVLHYLGIGESQDERYTKRNGAD